MSHTPTSFNSEIVAAYFEAWRSRSTEQVQQIFSDNAEYLIKVDGKKSYLGIDEIKQYWRKNAERQQDLTLDYQIIESRAHDILIVFFANFTDVDERQRQLVNGAISMEISTFEPKKICRLTEWYFVDRKPLSRDEWYSKPIAAVAKWSKTSVEALRRWCRKVLIKGFWISLIFLLIFTVTWFVQPPKWLIWLAMPSEWQHGWSATPDALVARRLESMQLLLSYVVTVLGTLIGFVGILQSSASGPSEILELDVTSPGSDLKVMNEYMKGAKNVVVFSGDFDFLSESPDLLSTFHSLTNLGRLTFVSDRERLVVRRGVSNCSEAVALLDALERDNRMTYDSDLRIHCSFVSRADENVILNYYTTIEHGQKVMKICAVRGQGRALEITRAVSELIRSWTDR